MYLKKKPQDYHQFFNIFSIIFFKLYCIFNENNMKPLNLNIIKKESSSGKHKNTVNFQNFNVNFSIIIKIFKQS